LYKIVWLPKIAKRENKTCRRFARMNAHRKTMEDTEARRKEKSDRADIANEKPAGPKVSRRYSKRLKSYFGGCCAGVVDSCKAFLLGMIPGTLGSVLTSPVTASSILML
jgi:hypothetical protein